MNLFIKVYKQLRLLYKHFEAIENMLGIGIRSI